MKTHMRTHVKTIDRRTVLRGLGGASIALPFLDIMGRQPLAQAQTEFSKIGFGGQPKRFLELVQAKDKQLGKAEAARADLRFHPGNDGRVYLLNKGDGVIRMLTR